MNRNFISLFCIVTAVFSVWSLQAQGTAFNYQGHLNDGGNPASGIYDLRFTIYDSNNIPGSVVAGPVTNSAVAVSNGLFAVTLDFGPGVFTGPDRWLQIAVRTNGAATFANLSPRQKILAVPYAIFANTASNLSGTLPAVQLSGTLPASAFVGYTATVVLTNSANQFGGSFSGTFTGNGGGVTNVNVTHLTGVLADNQLPANTAFVNSNQTFTGANNFSNSNNFTGPVNFSGTNSFHGPNNFTNWGNSFVGSFFGNGLVGWIATNATAVQADIDHGYLLTASQLTTLTLPATPHAPGDIVRVSGGGAGGWRVGQNSGQSIIGNFLGFGNSTWLPPSTVSAASWQCIAASADGIKMVAAIAGGGIYVSRDSGKTWSPSSANNAQWHSVASSADGTKLFAANGLGIYASTDSGGTWTLLTAGPSADLIACSADGTKLLAAANNGSYPGLYTSGNSGSSWTYRTTGASWSAVASSADGTTLVAVFNGGQIYTSSNSGVNWTARDSSRNWVAVAESAQGTRMIAAVSSGGLYTSTDSGANWTPQTSAPNANWSCVAASADGARFIAGISTGGIYASANSGVSWTKQNVPDEPWTGLASSADGTVLAATFGGANGGIYYAGASAQSVTTTGTAGGITGVQGTAVELQYVGGGKWMPVSSVGTIWAY